MVLNQENETKWFNTYIKQTPWIYLTYWFMKKNKNGFFFFSQNKKVRQSERGGSKETGSLSVCLFCWYLYQLCFSFCFIWVCFIYLFSIFFLFFPFLYCVFGVRESGGDDIKKSVTVKRNQREKRGFFLFFFFFFGGQNLRMTAIMVGDIRYLY